MKKYLRDLVIRKRTFLQSGYVLLQLTDYSNPLPEMLPGQFVEIKISSPDSFLRCPISINWVDVKNNELWLLIHIVGDATRTLTHIEEGTSLDVMFPLGNGFTLPQQPEHVLLVGGGVGTAPLLYLGAELKRRGSIPTFLLGARAAKHLLQLDMFCNLGQIYVATEDDTLGEKGFVTQHSIWQEYHFDRICTCGPKPMMKAVAQIALEKNYPCEASLENMMACGIGACLCCVEDTTQGNLCVCKDGPIFDVKLLKWF